ncbi:nucleotide sugar dehydrogenase [Sphingobium sp. V4]|uniref:nucleotide sugar dehydrogenase n=1 Tax=Sphingobium sp. V4 TaxID=3038927 RepID=UPI002557E0C6|nr:nucleotide sugar dehydrogenase [Sphingobium sp. V4]WIW89960.1 nucleotide sugar dehydrogenase [Sphingobium sp. V4]
MPMNGQERIAVIGLGYVGLPLAIAFAGAGLPVIGFDIDHRRVAALRDGHDWTGEIGVEALRTTGLVLTDRPDDLADVTFWIVTVPTPVDANHCPDLGALRAACETVGAHMRPGAAVVIESTVYPGTTEDVCGPLLEQASGLARGVDFVLGYSPERINPGDTKHGIADVVKIVAGQNMATLDRVAAIYGRIVPAGLHRAPSIAVAETAKVIENTQRDLNIALMNEVAKVCHLLDIRTSDVLAAAGTKWNFLKFHPGLVGGHCIGVDPYYLTARAQQLGYHPEVILAGRRINAGMGAYVAGQVVRTLAISGVALARGSVGILGLTFKENVPDLRNSAMVDMVRTLRDYGLNVLLHDPIADEADVGRLFGAGTTPLTMFAGLDALVLAVPHRVYDQLSSEDLRDMLNPAGMFADVRSRFDSRLFPSPIHYWSL